jgi:hypothetical protein
MIFPPLTNIFSKNPELSSGWLRNPASPWMVETLKHNGINHLSPGTGFLHISSIRRM